MARDRIFIDDEKIIDIAYDLINEVGCWKFSTRKLAETLEVSPMTLYNYIANKNEIISRVYLKGMRNLHSLLSEQVGNEWGEIEKNPLRIYKIFSLIFMKFAKENRNIYELVFSIPGIGVTENKEIIRLYSGSYDMIAHLIRPEKAQQAKKESFLFLVLVNGLVSRYLREGPGFTEETYHDLIDEAMGKIFSPLD